MIETTFVTVTTERFIDLIKKEERLLAVEAIANSYRNESIEQIREVLAKNQKEKESREAATSKDSKK